jgi:hypothetical protein
MLLLSMVMYIAEQRQHYKDTRTSTPHSSAAQNLKPQAEMSQNYEYTAMHAYMAPDPKNTCADGAKACCQSKRARVVVVGW